MRRRGALEKGSGVVIIGVIMLGKGVCPVFLIHMCVTVF
jgi:hypothetical protein